jgi:hypothetical protein
MTDTKREWWMPAPRRDFAPAASTVSRARVVPIAPRPAGARTVTDAAMAPSDDPAAGREHEDDIALLRAVARGDRRAFEALYYRHAPRLGRYVMRLLGRRDLVDEVIDDVMLVVWQNAGCAFWGSPPSSSRPPAAAPMLIPVRPPRRAESRPAGRPRPLRTRAAAVRPR